MIAFGNAMGRSMSVFADGHDHRANEYGVIVGDTSRARKGTAWRRTRAIMTWADPDWVRDNIPHGLSSGEGIIYRIRDEGRGTVGKKGEAREPDQGVKDKRLLVVEEEFANVLRVLSREGNTLSGVLRLGWDGDTLEVLTKNSPMRASNPHVSFLGHITIEELMQYLSQVEIFNGLGNRILWSCVRRSKLLPLGGKVPDRQTQNIAQAVKLALEHARGRGQTRMTPAAESLWRSSYAGLTETRPGMYGAVTSRAEAHSLRLALKYCALDRSDAIDVNHVRSALALWAFHDRCAAYLFGSKSGDPAVDKALAALKAAGPAGLSRNQIYRDVFKAHKSGESLARLLSNLLAKNLVHRVAKETSGRPEERFFYGRP
jgi:hypothetical protein